MKIDPNIISQYLPADEDFVVNIGKPDGTERDPSLTPIRISLPKPPKLELIDGYGLKSEEQFWRRPQMPEKLVALKSRVEKELQEGVNKGERVTGYKILDAIWSEIENNVSEYEEEIKFIKIQWWHRINGYFFYNFGKPTYICGWHYFYLTWWKIEARIYPEFRDRDRKNFLFWWYSKNTKEAFKYYDKDGYATLNENGEYETVEMPSRVCYGDAQPKNRRGGTTNMSQSCQYEDTSRMIGALAAMFSVTETSASALFQRKTVKSWAVMPFFFLPTWAGYFNESSAISFKNPKNIILGDQLNSTISYAKSAFGAEYDGERLSFAIFDESGKCVECDVTERWDVHKQGMAVADGADIIGFCLHPSTVEEMDDMGGAHYQNLIYASNFYQRNPVTGQTKSGLFRIFFPGYEGLEGFIGKHGESIIDEPTEYQIKNGFKYKHGSKKHLQSNRDMLLNSKDPKDQIKYRRLVVKFPFTLDECFKLTIGSTSWDIDILDKRLAELRRIKEPFIRGDFAWENGVKFGRVIFIPKIEGKFEVSLILPDSESNQKVRVTIVDPVTGDYKECWSPKYVKKGIVGSDAFKFKGDKLQAIETGSYQSDGGIVARQLRDYNIDPSDKNIFECKTPRNIAAYRNRPLSDEYNEDVLMCAIYYGYKIYPETNAGTLWEFCVKHGYDEYLLYDIDPATGKYKSRPGCYQMEKSKETMWTLIQNYVSREAYRENHATILTELSKLKQFADLNRLDLAAAFGCCLLGEHGLDMQKLEDVDESNNDLSFWLEL
jgi:hypothetical protein